MKHLITFINCCLFLFLCFLGLIHYNSTIKYEYSPAKYVDISEIIEKEVWDDNDYEILLQQTGLTRYGLELVEKEDLVKFQEEFINPYEVRSNNLNSFTIQDTNVLDGRTKSVENIVPLKAGDIIISITNHSFGVQHGHSAIMVNSEDCLFIDNIFSRSRVEHVDVMTRFSSFLIVRPRVEMDFEKYFEENLDKLLNKPYLMLASKKAKEFKGGICSYLTWFPYHEMGVDIDSNGGYFVMPKDILRSDKLKTLQVYGVNRADLVI